MKFGVREICDVVLKAKAAQKVGDKVFYKNEPVIYFDTLKTSSMEGAATTVYAQGGRGNSRLVAWEGERTITYTMEDALISPAGFMILSGAGLIEAKKAEGGKSAVTIKQHMTQQAKAQVTNEGVVIELNETPYEDKTSGEKFIYVMALDDNGEVNTEPYSEGIEVEGKVITITSNGNSNDLTKFKNNGAVLVDFYVERDSGAQQIEITADKFGGNYYLEASTLFRDQNGVDMPAEFIIPNCKIQSNFTFTMASSGDPSTFTFTMDAFPDYTRFDNTKKVLAAIQIIADTDTENELKRVSTPAEKTHTWNDSIDKLIDTADVELESIAVLGPKTVASGESATYTFVKYPENAIVNNVKWTISPTTNATIDVNTGKLTANKEAASDATVTVTATAGDVADSFEVTINPIAAG